MMHADASEPKPKKAPRNRKRFTDVNVQHFPTRAKQYQAWDTEVRGLSVLVSPGGIRSYRCIYYPPGEIRKIRTMHLGRVGEISLAEARELTRKCRNIARRGEDPRQVRTNINSKWREFSHETSNQCASCTDTTMLTVICYTSASP